MYDVKITKYSEGKFTHYAMTPGVLEYMPEEQHIATSTMSPSSEMIYVALTTVYHDLPAIPGAWFTSEAEADLAVEQWAQIIHLMKHYKSLITRNKDLEPPF